MYDASYCKKHDEREPYHWEIESLGLWMCPACAEDNISTNKEINDAVKKITNNWKRKNG